MQTISQIYAPLYNVSANTAVLGSRVKQATTGTAFAPLGSTFASATSVPFAAVSQGEPRLRQITGTDFKKELEALPETGTIDTFKGKPKGFIGDFAGAVQSLATTDISKVDPKELKKLLKDPPRGKPEKKVTFREAAKQATKRGRKRKAK